MVLVGINCRRCDRCRLEACFQKEITSDFFTKNWPSGRFFVLTFRN